MMFTFTPLLAIVTGALEQGQMCHTKFIQQSDDNCDDNYTEHAHSPANICMWGSNGFEMG